MIDGLKVGHYLDDTGLNIQQFWFLYSVMCCEDNMRNGKLRIPQTDDNKDFNEVLYNYFNRHGPNIGTNLKWSDVAYALEEDDWITIAQKTGTSPLKLENCFVTDKFKSHFLISDVEKAFHEFLERYPKWVVTQSGKYIAMDKAPEILTELYSTKILKKGNALLHERCLLITEMFIRDNDGNAPYKISTYLEDKFPGIALAYEDEDYKPKKSSTGRRIG